MTEKTTHELASRRRWIFAFLAVFGVAASMFLANTLHVREQRLFEAELDRRARERSLLIERELQDDVTHVRSVAALYRASGAVDRKQFEAFTRSILHDHQCIKGLGFDAFVRGDQRTAHEQAARSAGFPDYRITERSPDGKIVPAAPRDSYVAVTLLEPVEGNEAAVGFDIASEPVRREALARARDTGEPAITGRLSLVQDATDRFGALICVPVYVGEAPVTVSERRERLHGYSVGIVQIADVVNRALHNLDPTGINLRLEDLSAGPGRELLYTHVSRTTPDRAAADISPDDAGYKHTHVFELAGRRWSVEGVPTRGFRDRFFTWTPLAVFVVGCLVTGMLLIYLSWQAALNRRLRRAIEERRKAEEAQIAFGRMLDGCHDEIYFVDSRSLRFLHANRGALQNLGYSIEELRNMTLLDLNPKLNPRSLDDTFRPLLLEQQAKVELTTEHLRKDGSTYDVEIHLQLSTFDANRVIVAVCLDVTDRRQLEEQLRQSQRIDSLGTLAGGIAHDFNNLLVAIMGYTELSLDALDPATPVAGNLHKVLAASERARDTVRQILAFSRSSPFEEARIALPELIREALQLIRASLPATVTIEADVVDDCRILGDPSQIHQVLMNLCTNAAHAMRGSGGTLSIRLDSVTVQSTDTEAHTGIDPGEYARMRVRDTGHGIPVEVRDRIFDPFFTTKEPGEGTGMGLSVVHGIVRSHRGSLAVTSDPSWGSQFEVLLPRCASVTDCVETRHELPGGGGESVLVVDDEPVVANLLSEMLTLSGYVVETYNDSVEALEAFRARPTSFDVVLTDYTMPRMRGTELARAMNELCPGVVVVLVSGYGVLLDDEEISESGVCLRLTKPVRREELVETIRRALGQTVRPEPAGVP